MTEDTQAENKLDEFIDKLASLGYDIQQESKKPQIYSIDGQLVNIRSRSEHKLADGNRLFWYSVTYSVLQEVKWVIYLMTTSDYFVMLPSSFLQLYKEDMYEDNKNSGVGVFDIDWDGLAIELKGKRIPIDGYAHDLVQREYYPTF